VDILESFVLVKARLSQVWPFVTQMTKIAMWAAPFAEPVAGAGGDVLDEAHEFDIALALPGRPRLHCLVLSLGDGTVTCKVDGYVRGLATWRLVPAGEDTIVHVRLRYELADRRWLVLWALGGRWGAALALKWALRRFKARVEDTAGSSRFGVPLLVSRYAVAGAAALAGAVLGLVGLRVGRWLRSQVDADG
jgi:hypothetical protein